MKPATEMKQAIKKIFIIERTINSSDSIFFLLSLKMSHKYINYIQLLSEKADKWQRYCICVSCKERLVDFLTKSERVITHLKRCSNFKVIHPEVYG